MMDTVHALARQLGAVLPSEDAAFARVVTDTRQLQEGDLFVALRGDRFDAHDFIAQARQQGAVAALVSRPVEDALPQVVVPDTLLALQRYATLWRGRFSIPVIGVTGSNGKTTTKQMLASIMAVRGPVLATEGNLNNHIGVPLTLLRLRGTHRTAVIEMGANHAGEIALLAGMARPDVGLVTMAGDAHLEGFGSREGVARAKGEMFAALAGGIAVINADDVYEPLWQSLAKQASVIRFGLGEQADVRALQLRAQNGGMHFVLRTPAGDAAVQLPLPGVHNVRNALGAAACGIGLGLDVEDIAAGLAAMQGAAGRVNWKTTQQGARLLDDSYNANPSSLRAGLEVLAAEKGQRWLILGGMAELGPRAQELHEEAGRTARALGIDRVLGLGPLAGAAARAFGTGGESFEQLEDLLDCARAQLGADGVVLVKGSRSARMERVVAALCGESGGEH